MTDTGSAFRDDEAGKAYHPSATTNMKTTKETELKTAARSGGASQRLRGWDSSSALARVPTWLVRATSPTAHGRRWVGVLVRALCLAAGRVRIPGSAARLAVSVFRVGKMLIPSDSMNASTGLRSRALARDSNTREAPGRRNEIVVRPHAVGSRPPYPA